MGKHIVIKIVSLMTMMVGFVMTSSIIVAYVMEDCATSIMKMAISAILAIIIPFIIFKQVKKNLHGETIGFREGFAIVTLSWIAASLVSTIPYMLVGSASFVDGFFESMSGFSTTGASIFNNIEELPKGLLFWRAMTHWLGGMGIVVLSLAILPVLGVGGQQLFKAEVPGPISDQLTPKIADSAKILWGVYVFLTIAEIIALRIANMPWFDSICHSFSTMATGGFSTKQASIEYYHNAPGFSGGIYIDAIITFFMFLAGCNFILHLQALRGKTLNYFKDEEFKKYFYITLFAIISMTFFLLICNTYPEKSLGYLIQNTSFTSVSVLTTTGFCTGDFNIWPQFCRILLFFLMFIGGCGGSTAGGMKVSRVILILRYCKTQIQRCFFPHLVTNVQFNERRVKDSTNHQVIAFFAIFIGIFLVTAVLLTIFEMHENISFETSLSASIACLGNVGPGLGNVGPWENFSWLSSPSKFLLTFTMLAGRLEIFTVMVLFLPKFWKK